MKTMLQNYFLVFIFTPTKGAGAKHVHRQLPTFQTS